MRPQKIAIATPDGRREGRAAEEAIKFHLRPQNIRVLVLDDDDKVWRERIRRTLASQGISCEAVKKLSQFTTALQHAEYDVASIDWELERAGEDEPDEDGADAISMLRDIYPEIGKVIFSVHMGNPAVDREARHLGADRVVEKQAFGSDDEYVQAVLDAARLSLFRRVLEHLKRLGRQTEEFAAGRFGELSDEQERRVYAEALDALMASFLEGEEDGVLMNLLKRRGTLREFNSPRYISLPFYSKLAELLSYVRTTPEQLSQILGVDTNTAERLQNGDEGLELNEKEQQNVYWLASILDFVLRLSDDEPDLMPGFWTAKKLYAKSRNIPPWDSDGLCDYLIDNGAKGLEEAVRWIRSY